MKEALQSPQQLVTELVRPQPAVIALEGGPCGGKSTLLSEIAAQSVGGSREVVTVPEVASGQIVDLVQSGVTIESAQSDKSVWLDFQTRILEGIFSEIEERKQACTGTDAIIVIDRCDIGAYVEEAEYESMLARLDRQTPPLHHHVDKLYYLPSVARSDPAEYDRIKNSGGSVRYEDAEEAAATCARNLQAVSSHPELCVSWGGNFEAGISKLVRSILQPELEGEVKQDVPHKEAGAVIARSELLNVARIHQSYHSLDGQEFRLRKYKSRGAASYFFTIKQGEGVLRTELQRRISPEQYDLLQTASRIGMLLVKDRYTFLDQADAAGRRRMWVADDYLQPRLPFWHFETDVDSESEAEELDTEYAGIRTRATLGAKDLIFYGQTT